jgi:cAMP-binding proteins - catabolite gene activator and regulatory subunit of cAMP-dependent protein kinases
MNAGDVNWQSITLFDGLGEVMLDKVKAIFDVRAVPAGRDLIVEGEQGDEMFILISGRVRVTKSMLLRDMVLPIMETANPRKVLATLDGESHPVFGEIALIDSDTRSATIHVMEDSEFLVTNRGRFFELVDREPVLGNRLLVVLARRMASTVRKGNAELIKVSTALALALSRFRPGM